eukprot:scaffold152454_cov19-Tisochrysis_lutea.AAC.1
MGIMMPKVPPLEYLLSFQNKLLLIYNNYIGSACNCGLPKGQWFNISNGLPTPVLLLMFSFRTSAGQSTMLTVSATIDRT